MTVREMERTLAKDAAISLLNSFSTPILPDDDRERMDWADLRRSYPASEYKILRVAWEYAKETGLIEFWPNSVFRIK
jgi:hypothetical protein